MGKKQNTFYFIKKKIIKIEVSKSWRKLIFVEEEYNEKVINLFREKEYMINCIVKHKLITWLFSLTLITFLSFFLLYVRNLGLRNFRISWLITYWVRFSDFWVMTWSSLVNISCFSPLEVEIMAHSDDHETITAIQGLTISSSLIDVTRNRTTYKTSSFTTFIKLLVL